MFSNVGQIHHFRVVTPLRVDRGQLAARVAEQEKVIANLRKENETLGNQPQNRETSSLRIDLATARRDIVSLTDRNRELTERMLEQTKTISEFAVGQTERDSRIRELEGQIALETVQTEENDHNFEQSASTVSRFGAIAANGNGTVILTEIDFATAQDAALDARRACLNYGGGQNCIVRATVQDTCAAIARAYPGTKGTPWAVQVGATAGQAGQRAISLCERENGRSCQVTRQACPS